VKQSGSRTVVLMVLILLIGTTPVAGQTFRTVHVFVALADNQHQGIVPVPAALGNGLDSARNLYWGAAFGVKTYFRASSDWELISSGRGPRAAILDRCTFRHRKRNVFLVADAYEGSHIRDAVTDFLSAAAGASVESFVVKDKTQDVRVSIGGASDLVAYVGHDALWIFKSHRLPEKPVASGARL
jgi:hypothetical protein